MKSNYRNSPLVNIIIYVVIALLAVGCIGLIVVMTDGFGGKIQSFYVTIDEKNIMESDSNYLMSKGEYTDVKVNFLKDDEENENYTIKIVPTATEGSDFDFTSGGIVYSFQQTADYTAGFTIQRNDTGFLIRPKGNLETVIEAAYGAEIENLNALSYDNMFTMIISSADEKSNIYIQFSILEPVTDVTLDKEAIIF